MSKFGQTLFGGGGFIRWTLSPFVLLFAVVMPLVIDEWTFGRVGLIVCMELMCVSLLAGFWLPPRIGFWAFRFLAGMVALAYAAYLVDEFFVGNRPFTVTGQRSDASPFNALLGFLVIGVPSLLFAVLGRFSLRPPPEPEPDEHTTESDDDAASETGQ
jgi:hypothetical protein